MNNTTFSLFSKRELMRYSRHFALNKFGSEGQIKLKQAKVLCIGAGGLGCPILGYLAAAGVGMIAIVDPDCIDLSNLQRQILYRENQVGHSKVVQADKILRELNSDIEVVTYEEKLTKTNARQFIEPYDLIIDASDNFECRYISSDVSYFFEKPYFYSSIFEYEGQYTLFCAGDSQPCYRCFNPVQPPVHLSPNCSEVGVLGALTGIIGSYVAMEVIKYIAGVGQPSLGKLFSYNALTNDHTVLKLAKNKSCILCATKKTFEQLPFHKISVSAINYSSNNIDVYQLQHLMQTDDVQLIDVRESYEHLISNIGGLSVPLSEISSLPQKIMDRNKPLIVYCKSGKRSSLAIKILNDLGYRKVRNLKGGVLAWKSIVDPTFEVV